MKQTQGILVIPAYVLLLASLYFDYNLGVFVGLGVIVLTLILRQIRMHKSGSTAENPNAAVDTSESTGSRTEFDMVEDE
ncbi:hypothetical protein [Radiobacillus sp. PE A8.2]|uniref:hypothetical protein n=1 Tax=Radiobacillus sp. PE A8.2 TaxID=3380349 RepID=UPI00388ECF17